MGLPLLAGERQDGGRPAAVLEKNRLDRPDALRLYTAGSCLVFGRRGQEGGHVRGQLADLAVLSADYFTVPEEEIKGIESVLTMVGGNVVYGVEEFAHMAPPPMPILPEWSPVRTYGGCHSFRSEPVGAVHTCTGSNCPHGVLHRLSNSGRSRESTTLVGIRLRVLCVLKRRAGRSSVAVMKLNGGLGLRSRIMKTFHSLSLVVLLLSAVAALAVEKSSQGDTEKSFQAPGNVTVTVRMQAPYDVDTPLQVICYFKHKETGDKTLGAAVELDKKLGGIIASLRNRGEFVGDELETLLLTPPKGTIQPKRLLLVGLGDENALSLDTLERVGKVSLRMAAALGVRRVAFAPLLRDQGDCKFGTGDVGRAVTRGMVLAYDADKRLTTWRRRLRSKRGWTKQGRTILSIR